MEMENKTGIELFVIKKVKEYRIQNNMSQADLAHAIGVSHGFIGKVESRKHTSKYNLNHLNKIAKVFNCSPAEFFPKKPI